MQNNLLNGVAGASGSVWAVGWSMRLSPHSASTVILRWTGTACRRVKSPHPGQSGGDELQGVTAIASNIAWAAGDYRDPNTAMDRTLVVRWNGKSWTHVASPTPPLPNEHDWAGWGEAPLALGRGRRGALGANGAASQQPVQAAADDEAGEDAQVRAERAPDPAGERTDVRRVGVEP